MKQLILISFLGFVFVKSLAQKVDQNLPVSTQLTISSASVYNKNNEVLNVLLIINSATQSNGTGFFIESRQIITCEHVVHGAKPSEITLKSSTGIAYAIKNIVTDSVRDLAIITLFNRPTSGFKLGADNVLIGRQVFTWGFPLGYLGPSPLLSVGYVAGIVANRTAQNSTVKHLVVNGAFNPGNSGGPLVDSGKVIGVVQSKAAPMTQYISSALKAQWIWRSLY